MDKQSMDPEHKPDQAAHPSDNPAIIENRNGKPDKKQDKPPGADQGKGQGVGKESGVALDIVGASTILLAVATFALAVFTAILAKVTADMAASTKDMAVSTKRLAVAADEQGHDFKTSIALSQAQVHAAEQANIISRDALARSKPRPVIVGVLDLSEVQSDGVRRVSLVMTNVGKSAAVHVSSEISKNRFMPKYPYTVVADGSACANAHCVEQNNFVEVGPSNTPVYLNFTAGNDLSSGTPIFFKARIKYGDGQGQEFSTDICYSLTGDMKLSLCDNKALNAAN